MYDLYRVTLNGSPVAGLPAVPLQAAAYAAAVMTHKHRDLGPGVRAREYGVAFSHTVERLTIRQWRAQSAAGDIAWDELTLYVDEDSPVGIHCDAYDLIRSEVPAPVRQHREPSLAVA